MQNSELLCTKYCRRCQQIKPITEFSKDVSTKDGKNRLCRDCIHRRHQAIPREKRREWSQNGNSRIAANGGFSKYAMACQRRYPLKNAARKSVLRAIRRGDLIPGSCEVCGQFPTEAHHWNYDLPLVVVWLCKQHHRFIHGQTCNI